MSADAKPLRELGRANGAPSYCSCPQDNLGHEVLPHGDWTTHTPCPRQKLRGPSQARPAWDCGGGAGAGCEGFLL